MDKYLESVVIDLDSNASLSIWYLAAWNKNDDLYNLSKDLMKQM